MRLVALCVVVLGFVEAKAQPACPFDARVLALRADAGVELEAIADAVRQQREVKQWLAAPGQRCSIATNLKLVRVLEGLTQRCALALVELERTVSRCRRVNVIVGGRAGRAWALIGADASGALRPVWSSVRADPPFPDEPPVTQVRAECAGSLFASDGGVVSVRAIAADPALRFEGCTTRGVPEPTVRQEVLDCLARTASSDVTVRFSDATRDAGDPLCVVTTRQLDDERVAVVRAGGLVHAGPRVDSPPRFEGTSAYLGLGRDGGTSWLCADLGLDPSDGCVAPTGCVPSKTNPQRLARANERSCPDKVQDLDRRELAVRAGAGAALRVERAVLERGPGLGNEAALGAALETAAAALGGCAANPAAYDGALGTVVVSQSGAVAAVSFEARKGDEACVHRAVISPLRAFPGEARRDGSMSLYRFRLR